MSPEVLAIIARFVAVDEFERARIVAEGAKGEGCNGGVVGGRWGSFGLTLISYSMLAFSMPRMRS